MADDQETAPTVWALTTQEVPAAEAVIGASMTPVSTAELRTVLAAFADSPIATLEMHAVPDDLDRSQGIRLGSASPLARHLADLAQQATQNKNGEALYRMVVPPKFAAAVGGELLNSMKSSAVPGGIHSALTGPSGIAGHASFVRAAPTAVTVVAPALLLLTVAAGVSLFADRQRSDALDKITELLERIRRDDLESKVHELNGCRGAIEKATAILLDRSGVGVQLGLDAAAHVIDTAVEEARSNLKKWRENLDSLGDGPVEVGKLRKKFEGIDREDGEFGVRLRMADLAISLKKRLIVIQAVAQAQADPGNPLINFVRVLKKDQDDLIELESRLADLKRSLGRLQLDRSHGVRDGFGLTAGDVDYLLRTIYRLRDLGENAGTATGSSDVVVDILQDRDGSVVVFPALPA